MVRKYHSHVVFKQQQLFTTSFNKKQLVKLVIKSDSFPQAEKKYLHHWTNTTVRWWSHAGEILKNSFSSQLLINTSQYSSHSF